MNKHYKIIYKTYKEPLTQSHIYRAFVAIKIFLIYAHTHTSEKSTSQRFLCVTPRVGSSLAAEFLLFYFF